jgi:hypothetical protein
MSDEIGYNEQREHEPIVEITPPKINLQWHELKCGDVVEVKRTKLGKKITAEVLSFRKVMAIVLFTDGQYELFEPGEFNDFYSAKLVK